MQKTLQDLHISHERNEFENILILVEERGDAPVGIPPFFFNNYRLVSVEPKFLLLHMMSAILEMSFYFVLLAV